MKINAEFDLGWINEDYTIDDLVKEEIIRKASEVAGELLAKQDFDRLTYGSHGTINAEFKASQEAYRATVEEIKEKSQADREAVFAKIDSVFEAFLEEKALSLNIWGQPAKEYTVKEFILSQIEARIKDMDKTLEKLVAKRADETMRLSERHIRELVDSKAKEIQNENAKAVAEFIVKGLK